MAAFSIDVGMPRGTYAVKYRSCRSALGQSVRFDQREVTYKSENCCHGSPLMMYSLPWHKAGRKSP